MQKVSNAYDTFGNEYGIFVNGDAFELWDCFEYTHDGAPIARGSYELCKSVLSETILEQLMNRF